MKILFLCSIVGGTFGIKEFLNDFAPLAGFNSSTGIDTASIEFEYDTINMDRATTYYPSLEQCARRDSAGNIDSSSNIYNTACGSVINMEKLRKREIRWIALPKSMLCRFGGGPFNFNDSVLFYSKSSPQINGEWIVKDVVSGKWGKTVDFLMLPENNKPKLGTPHDVKILMNKRIKK